MKKIFYLLTLVLFVSVSFQSCTKDEVTFDETLLYGKWQSGTLFYVYQSNGNGYYWNPNDDITEEEAKPFTWTLKGDNLTHYMTVGSAIIPEPVTVIELTETTLKYKDGNKQVSFTKVN